MSAKGALRSLSRSGDPVQLQRTTIPRIAGTPLVAIYEDPRHPSLQRYSRRNRWEHRSRLGCVDLLLAEAFTHNSIAELMPQLLVTFLDSCVDILDRAALC